MLRRQIVQEGAPPAPDVVPPRAPFSSAVELSWRVTWGAQSAPRTPQYVEAVHAPPPRPPMLVPMSVGGVFYPQTYTVPMRLPSGIPPVGQVDVPTPHVPLPPQILDHWIKVWDAQRARMLTPPTVAVVEVPYLAPARAPESIHRAWLEPVHLSLLSGGTPEPSSGDLPPPKIVLPAYLWRAWVSEWSAQSALSFDYSALADQPPPLRPVPRELYTAWLTISRAQRASVSAAWDVPPTAPGDQITFGRHVARAVLLAWEPRFILPPARQRFPLTATPGDAPPVRSVSPRVLRDSWDLDWAAQSRPLTVTFGRAGDDPPPFTPLPAAVLRAWQRTWAAQHGPAFSGDFTIPPSVIKGLIVRHVSGVLYQVTSVGDQYYLVRIT